MQRSSLRILISRVPDAPGVYIMKDASGKIIYVGKAKSLKKRLSNYLGADLSEKTMALVSHISDIEYRLTPTESLALVLEAGLIHEHQPKYNISLRDDKSFPFVRISAEEFPVICVTRKKQDDGARYFGPYTSAKLLREALIIIRRHFPYRSCRQMPREACLYYRIGLSPAPCAGKINAREYSRTIENIILILKGRTELLVKKLTRQMQEKSRTKDFEAAAKLRDSILALSRIGSSYAGEHHQQELADLKAALRLDKLPERIEAFDISNVSGKEATGAMVSFFGGLADKNNYRRFRIKTVNRIDDYSMLSEVVSRRYTRLVKENIPLPDLILIDGGRGHLAAAEEELRKLKLDIPMISLAKEEENIYQRGSSRPLRLNKDSAALNLLRRVRDEAHRFAVAYHHILRRKKIIGR